MKLHLLAALALSTFVLAACDGDDDDGTGPSQTARVRIVNAGNFATGASVFVGNSSTALMSNLSTGTSGAACVAVPAGSQMLTFRAVSGAATLATTASFNFQANQRYTVILTGSGTSGSATVLSDNAAPTAGSNQNALRFFNASGNALDLYLTTQGGAIGSPAHAGLANNASTTNGTAGFTLYGSDLVQLRAFTAGSATTGTPSVNYTIAPLGGDRTATVVIRNNSSAPQVMVTPTC